jgi:hypothetical protein
MPISFSGETATLWIEALDIPTATAIVSESKAVMQAMFAISPKFDFLWHNAKSTPMWWASYRVRESGFNSADFGGQIITAS